MTKYKNYLLLGIIVAVGLGMRIFHNLDISLWHDEAFSALLIKYPWGEMMHRIGLDVHPPMYYIALRVWGYIFGDSLAALRGFSIFFGTATIVAVYELVKAITSGEWRVTSTKQNFSVIPTSSSVIPAEAGIHTKLEKSKAIDDKEKYMDPGLPAVAQSSSLVETGMTRNLVTHNTLYAPLLAAILVAINPFQIGFSLEARMYTFGAFLAVLAAYFLVRALSSIRYKVSGIYYALFSITSGLAILTHYYLIFTIAALCLYGLIKTATSYKLQATSLKAQIANYKSKTWQLIFSYIIIGVSFLPWLKIFFFQFKQVGNGYWIPKMDLWSMPSTIYEMLIGAGVDTHKTSTQIILILVTTAIIYITISFLRKSTFTHKGLIVFAWLSPFVGSLLFTVLAKLKGSDSSVYLIRYFAFSAPFFSIMLAMWLGELRVTDYGLKNLRSLFAIRYSLFAILLITNLYTFFHYWQELKVQEKPGMKAAVELLKNNTKQGDILVVGSSFEFFNLKYYMQQINKPWNPKYFCADDQGHCKDRNLPNYYFITPKLYSGGQTTIDNMPHFAGTAILTNEDLLPNFESIDSDNTAWILWTNGFGGSKPEVPSNWSQEEEHGFAEVRPYVGTWIVVDKYKIK